MLNSIKLVLSTKFKKSDYENDLKQLHELINLNLFIPSSIKINNYESVFSKTVEFS